MLLLRRHQQHARRWLTAAKPTAAAPSPSPLQGEISKTENKLFPSLHVKLREALKRELKMSSFTKPQNEVAQGLVSGRNLIIQADAKLSKRLSLAYLLPILNRVMTMTTATSYNTKLRSPRAIILGPSSEFVKQTGELISRLAPEVKCLAVPNRVRPSHDDGDYDEIGTLINEEERRQILTRPIDVLVTEPKRLSELVQIEHVSRQCLQILVCDGMDDLYKKDFYELMYFFSKTDERIRRACALARRDERDVAVSELKFTLNEFQFVALVDKLSLTRVQRDFQGYVVKPPSLLDFTALKKK